MFIVLFLVVYLQFILNGQKQCAQTGAESIILWHLERVNQLRGVGERKSMQLNNLESVLF